MQQAAGDATVEERVDRAEKPTSAHLRVDDLPSEFEFMADDLDAALNDDAPPMEIESGEYTYARDAIALVEVLTDSLHDDLADLEMTAFYRSSLRDGGAAANAKVRVVPARWRSETGLRYYLDVNHPRWVEMSAVERIRTVDHELCHLEYDVDKDSLSVGRHPVEEFPEIVARYGPRENEQRLADAIEQGSLDL